MRTIGYEFQLRTFPQLNYKFRTFLIQIRGFTRLVLSMESFLLNLAAGFFLLKKGVAARQFSQRALAKSPPDLRTIRLKERRRAEKFHFRLSAAHSHTSKAADSQRAPQPLAAPFRSCEQGWWSCRWAARYRNIGHALGIATSDMRNMCEDMCARNRPHCIKSNH
jgi:hypothetical protein